MVCNPEGTHHQIRYLLNLSVTKRGKQATLQRHHRVTLCRLQKLPSTSPDCVVLFFAGSLPSTALLNMRQLGLLSMLARLGTESILQKVGRQVLLSDGKGKS